MAVERWEPCKGPQERFLASRAFEVLYGGQAGGGKTESLLVAPTRWLNRPQFRGLLLRRTVPELEQARGIIDRSREIYPSLGGVYREQRKTWLFPSGAQIKFDTCEHEADRFKFLSAEIQFAGFDELTTFTLKIYLFVMSRLRSSHGIPIRLRAGSNPGGIGHEWVLERFAPWLYQPGKRLDEHAGPYADPCAPLYYLPPDDENPDAAETVVPKGTPGALSRVFIPATLEDNPHLAGTGYDHRLRLLDPLTREHLAKGNWFARPVAGMFFQRAWIEIEDEAPAAFDCLVRFWDRAATDPKKKKKGKPPDWTVGLLLGYVRKVFWALDVVRVRLDPADVEATMKTTAELDATKYGKGVVIEAFEQEPGASGKSEAAHMVTVLVGHSVLPVRATGSKVDRAKPISAQAKAGNLKLLRAPWNEALITELEQFPDGAFDDQVDALSGAESECSATGSGTSKTSGKRNIANRGGGF